MPPETIDPGNEMSPATNSAVATPEPAQTAQPGLIVGICSIAAGVIGFSIPVLGMVVSCAGIWLGIKGFRQGRASNLTSSTVCGVIGASLSGLGIVFWISAVLFESYR
jgi:hypothetical protein